MRNVKLAFVVFVLLLLTLPWWPLPEMRIRGFEPTVNLPMPSMHTVWEGKLQKDFEAWWMRHFGSRGTLLVLKNTLHDLLNGGMFHAGYRGYVVQGRDGVLFDKVYVLLLFSPADTPAVRAIIRDNVTALAALRDALARLDVPLVLVMAPNKATFRMDALPPVWQFLTAHRTVSDDPFALYTLYAQACAEYGLLCVNSPHILKQAGLLQDAFPDQGTHWSMYAAGLAWQEATRLLHTRQPGRFPEVELKAPVLTTASLHYERDIANLLNIFPPYTDGRPERVLAKYMNLSQPARLSGLSLGDSFSVQLSRNIILSLFSTQSQLLAKDNWIPDRQTFFHNISVADFFVLTYTEPVLHSPRIRDEAQRYVQLLHEVVPVSWHDFEPAGQGQWSHDTSFLHFLNIYDGDIQLALTIKNIMPTVTACTISVNGNTLTTLDMRETVLPRKVSLNIPAGYLKKGENIIALDVKGATMPASLSHDNPDLRLLGIYCSDFAIAEEKR